MDAALEVTNHSTRVLITGATGAVGPSVVLAFQRAGYRVRTISRKPPPSGLFPDAIEAYCGDITDRSATMLAMEGVGIVVHLASLLHLENPSPHRQAEYVRVNVKGTETILQTAIQANVKRVVFVSSIAVYGSGSGNPLDETSPALPDTIYGATKLAAERLVLDAQRPDGAALGTVLRLAAVYGARLKGNYARLVQALARGRFVLVGDGQNRRTLIHDKDAARAAMLAVTHPAAAGRLYNVTDGQNHSMIDITAAICGALGRKPPRLRLPLRPVRWAVGILEDGAGAFGQKLPLGRATVDKLTETIIVDGSRIRQELGFAPGCDLQTGWRDTISEMRQQHLL